MRVLQLRRRKNGRAITFAPRRLRFNADGSILAACLGAAPGVVAVEVHSGRVPELPTFPSTRTTGIDFSRNGEYVAVGGLDGTTRSYRLSDGTLLAELASGAPNREVDAVAFAPSTNPQSQWLVIGGRELWVWNPLTQQYLIAPDRGFYRAVAFEPNAVGVVVTNSHEVLRFVLRPFAETWRFRPAGVTSLFPDQVLPSPDGRVVAITTDGLTLFRVSADEGIELSRMFLVARPRDATFLPNSRLLAVADGSPTLRVYDTDTGTVAREYDWGIGGIHCVTFSHDGAMGAAGGDKGRVVVWDVE